MALGTLVFVQLLLLVYITISHFQPGALYRKQINKNNRRRYCNFIFRRLLAQLDKALTQRPVPGQEFICCRQAKQQALLAVRLFYRDTQKILHPEYELDTSAASDAYFVLDEEEAELSAAGYASLDFDVTEAFLKNLLYPKRFDSNSRNKAAFWSQSVALSLGSGLISRLKNQQQLSLGKLSILYIKLSSIWSSSDSS